MTTDVAIVIPAGRRLRDIIRDLVSHPASRCRLPRGLYLTWHCADGVNGRFQVLRDGVLPSAQEVETVRRDAKRASVVLGGMPEPVDVRHESRHWLGYAWATQIGGTQDKLPLFTPAEVEYPLDVYKGGQDESKPIAR
jgi:hypothetical protein